MTVANSCLYRGSQNTLFSSTVPGLHPRLSLPYFSGAETSHASCRWRRRMCTRKPLPTSRRPASPLHVFGFVRQCTVVRKGPVLPPCSASMLHTGTLAVNQRQGRCAVIDFCMTLKPCVRADWPATRIAIEQQSRAWTGPSAICCDHSAYASLQSGPGPSQQKHIQSWPLSDGLV